MTDASKLKTPINSEPTKDFSNSKGKNECKTMIFKSTWIIVFVIILIFISLIPMGIIIAGIPQGTSTGDSAIIIVSSLIVSIIYGLLLGMFIYPMEKKCVSLGWIIGYIAILVISIVGCSILTAYIVADMLDISLFSAFF